MKIFPTIFSRDKDIDRAVAANIGAIELRPRKAFHAEKIAEILDALHADKHQERERQTRLRQELEESTAIERETDELIAAYTKARSDIAA